MTFAGGTDASVAMVGLDVCATGKTAFITGSSHPVGARFGERRIFVHPVIGKHLRPSVELHARTQAWSSAPRDHGAARGESVAWSSPGVQKTWRDEN
jgi:hypothetical protein